MKTIQLIQNKIIPTPAVRKKVAAYARVSMITDRLHHSLNAQVDYFKSMIASKPEWQFAGVYYDEGLSGTSVRREGFQKLLNECENGNIDIILVKSISRFARNTLDLLNTARHLKEIGVEIRFEKEGISTFSMDGELMLTLLASFAEEESRSISENVKWGTHKRFKDGIPNGHYFVIGYRWTEDHDLYIYEPEAEIVRRIFREYIAGAGSTFIASTFDKEGLLTPLGNKWRDTNINKILTNSIYTGELVFQKSYCPGIGLHSQVNNGILPKYLIENHHPAIVSKEDFEKAQAEMLRRHIMGFKANNAIKDKITFFTGMIECGECGRHFVHSIKRNHKTGGLKEDDWVCTTNKKAHWKQKRCSLKRVHTSVVKKEFAKLVNASEFSEEQFLNEIEKIVVPYDYALDYHFKNGVVRRVEYKLTGHKDCWTEERRRAQAERMRQGFKRLREERLNAAKDD